MKNKCIILILGSLLMGFIGCGDYDKPVEENSIYVNRKSLSIFVGDRFQLTASPTEGTYHWTSEDLAVATVTSGGLVEAVGAGSTSIIASGAGVSTKVPITAVVRIPLQDIVLSDESLELLPGNKKTVDVTFVPENANDMPPYSWHSENQNVATVNEGGEITVVSEGLTNIVYRIGDIEKKISVDVAFTRSFKGPHVLSASAAYELPAANFDLGGDGYAFHDNDKENRTNNNYRANNGDDQSASVDIEGNGDNVGYTGEGEWLLYTVEVQDAGEYGVEVFAAVGGNGSFHLEVDGVDATGPISVPDMGGWGNYKWISSPQDKLTLSLTEGRHKIKYYFGGGHNVRILKFTKK
ncbi:MAG TPA: beta-glucanase/beta-glucan synthetase [Porphyromonadaceae bacterium]|nr:beta-glucanase/beta-glucan synthetase [Porphyromonadaceae bacterium]